MREFVWHCNEIEAQADLFADHLDGADLMTPVPSCPGWTIAQLACHVEAGLRWAREIVETRAESPPSDTELRDLSGHGGEDAAALAAALRASATGLAGALREAGPAEQVWCPVPGGGSAFFARRFAHETAVHRADAALALDIDYTLPNFLAVDGVQEWLELGCMPFHFEVHPWMRELLGPGRTIGLHTTDTNDDWLLDFTGDTLAWRRGPEQTAAELRGPVTDVLLVLYRRRPVSTVQIRGDAELVDFWLERVAFG
ncbi:maleylpyruvate isomerase family mycothiol-dependent enzyme [Mycolicibacterium sp. BiH015]|uniref:maleylpyruvate isomerase family mycothiol-dependent enzyme n=1 Tax=Mycolicibacterium sp. BiH015 TaxID=3018808 RepID=UPI0022E4FC06|nr:maleylpyruvate isomerase family mycothiol-dependent enzyme [Mycolicibacterium sp. BiH015]MDA2895226.1 maleylpyruvate isomerase family mycothiol-dependent enzyme [Mycolicibacterium sp. BiH015]